MIYLIVFVLYCLLLLSLTFLVIQPLGCERDINNHLLLLTNFTSLQINFVGPVRGHLSFRYGHEDLRHSIVRSWAFPNSKYCREHEIKLYQRRLL